MRFVAAIALLTLATAVPAGAQKFTPLTGTSSVQTPPGASTAPEAAPETAPSGRAARTRQPRMRLQERFDAANTSHDGKLTLDQAKAANFTRVVNNYDAIDTKKNGYVTMEDIRAWAKEQRAARKAAPK